jgi:hypothetical protein
MNTRTTNHPYRNIAGFSLALLIIGGMLFPAFSFAQSNGNGNGNGNGNNNGSDDTSVLAPIIAPFVGTTTDSDTEATNDEQTTPTPVATTTPAEPAPQATTTDPVATTTPADTRSNQSQRDTPRDNPVYQQTLENVLNTFIAPAETRRATTTPRRTTPRATSSTTTNATSTATSTATTTDDESDDNVTAPIGASTNGGSNQFAPNNYYIPFDRLSPEWTYGLSALAMVLGIVGATLILKSPAAEREVVWSPRRRQSLLEQP